MGRIPAALLLVAAAGLFVAALVYNEFLLGFVDPSPPIDPKTVTQVRMIQAWFLGAGLFFGLLSFAVRRMPRLGATLDGRLATNLLLTCLSVGIPLFVLELALRPFLTLEHETTSIFLRDDNLGWRMRPGAEDVWMGVHVSINDKGLRGPELDYNKPPGVTRILYLGDSVTFGFKLPSHDQTFPYQIQRLLREDGIRVQTLNAGVGGYSPWQEHIYLEKEGLRYDPDLVVVDLVLNDVIEKFGLVRYGGTGQGLQLERTATNRLSRWLAGSSILALGRRAAARIRFGSDVREGAERKEELEVLSLVQYPQRQDIATAWQVTLRNLTALFALCRERKVPAALVVFPYTFQFEDPDRLTTPQQILERFAADQSVPFLDLLPPLAGRMDEEGIATNALFFDRNHLTADGNRITAEIIAAWLKEEGFF